MVEGKTEKSKEMNSLSLEEGRESHEIQKNDGNDSTESQHERYNKIPPWSKQITARGLLASLVIGSMYSMIVMKLVLTTGLVPTLNVSAALVAFLFLRIWSKLLNKLGFVTTPFTKQENTVVQTCAVACYTISMGGGFGSYMLGLSKKIYMLAGTDMEGNTPGSYKDPEIGWITGFLFSTAFVGLLILVPLRKVMIIDYKLTFPSGTATAVLINGFHTPEGDAIAKKQVRGFTKFFSASLLWGFFQWFYSRGEKCGFKKFPTFGLRAREQTFFFDFNMTYVGAGMICSHLVNLSVLLGAVLSWGIMWPLIHGLKGKWYPNDIPESSMRSLQGYKVFIPIALILGDGIYQFLKVLFITARNVHQRILQQKNRTEKDNQDNASDEHQKDTLFMKDGVPTSIVCIGYAVCSIISVIAIPRMFPQVKWYYVIVAYIFAPALGFCNAYGAGLTDMNMSYNYGKIWLFVLAAWAGKDSGVVAGLVGAGIMKSMVSISADLMHDFKAGYLTNTSPRSMVISQAIGTAMGCIIAPLNFYLFFNAFDIGNPAGEYKAPFGLIYRNMAILGVEGFSALPQHCLQLCVGFFLFAVGTNLVRDFSPPKYGKFVPLPMAMGVPFLVGAYFAVDMCIGTLVVFVWNKMNSKRANVMVPAIASGLICGEGLWILPSSILALSKIKPPMCMKEALAVDGEFGLLEGRSFALVHPLVMTGLFFYTLRVGYLGWQWRRVRTVQEEINELKKQVKPTTVADGPEGASQTPPSQSPVELKIQELTEERKNLIKGSYRDRHFNAGSILLGFGVFEAVGGCVNTWFRTGQLFPGPHLFGGAGITVLWALAAALVPSMQKGNDTARNLHIALNALNVTLFLWQIPTGIDIVFKVFEFTTWP